MFILSICFALFLSPNRHPPEVREIFSKLPGVPVDAKLETVVRTLVNPLRCADAMDPSRPDELPRYYVLVETDYRLAIDFRRKVAETGEGNRSFGPCTFDGASVEKYNSVTRDWVTQYPVRERSRMQHGESGR